MPTYRCFFHTRRNIEIQKSADRPESRYGLPIPSARGAVITLHMVEGSTPTPFFVKSHPQSRHFPLTRMSPRASREWCA